jgi:hypothetical protein
MNRLLLNHNPAKVNASGTPQEKTAETKRFDGFKK